MFKKIYIEKQIRDSSSSALINMIIKLISSCQRESFLWDKLHRQWNYSNIYTHTESHDRPMAHQIYNMESK